ncbi:MAG: flotillin family protein [Planctomycetes bacterium]|nr:flotillin family protein [Planctomycetota bacterium]
MLTIILTITISTLVLAILVRVSGVIRFIPNNRVGVVEKLFGTRPLRHGLIALDGETGYQPEVLRGGFHLFPPFQYRIHQAPLVTIPQGSIGYVFARDGLPLSPGQTLGFSAGGDFQDVRGFLARHGQKGPQRAVLREGTYAINQAQFVVVTRERTYGLMMDTNEDKVISSLARTVVDRRGFTPLVIHDDKDLIGIVTVHEGPSLPAGEIIAPIVGDNPAQIATYHNKFQEPEHFLTARGMRGRQLQVLAEGTYCINCLFATVELQPKTMIEVGEVGVVVSYTGDKGEDLSGTAYSHGEMVERGKRGVWSEPLLPGKYPFNTYAGQVRKVPTTNIILKWIRSEAGSHRLDENLSEISLITRDAFQPKLPLSVVIHIDYRQAPLVIQRFGDIKKLVEQTLDPMVSAYFKDIGQTMTLIELIHNRAQIQKRASEEMRSKFALYNLDLQEVLIGTPASDKDDRSIETILDQLRARQVAREQIETYQRQQAAATTERELREAQARATVQSDITKSELSISIRENEGKAEFARSQQNAQTIRILAEAESDKVKTMALGEASRIKAVAGADAERAARLGVAQALAIEEQVRAYGGPRYQLTQQVMERFAAAVERSGAALVPRVVMNGGGSPGTGGGSGMIEVLLGMLMSDKLGDGAADSTTARDPAAVELGARLRKETAKALGATSG